MKFSYPKYVTHTHIVCIYTEVVVCVSLTLNEGEDIVYGAKWTPQSPFTSVFMYISENPEYEKETAMLIEEFLHQHIKNMKDKTGIFKSRYVKSAAIALLITTAVIVAVTSFVSRESLKTPKGIEKSITDFAESSNFTGAVRYRSANSEENLWVSSKMSLPRSRKGGIVIRIVDKR